LNARVHFCAAGLLFCAMVAPAGEAGQGAAAPALSEPRALSHADLPFPFDGPPPPAPPAVIARDGSGRVTVRAVRLTTPLHIDGQLDEAIYTTVPPMSEFIQVEPAGGEAATEQTEAWVTFDTDHVYVALRCRDSHPERMVANEMRRDNNNMFQNEYVGILLDTFYDRQNAFYFATTPIGGRADGQITNEKQYNGDLNPIWDLAVGRFDGGWSAEFAIPFKSLRYRPGRAQIWGFNVERFTKWKNEISFLTRLPVAMGNRAFMQISAAATLVGMEVPPPSMNLEIKPYATTNLTSDVTATPRVSNDLDGDAGLDLKYGVTQNLTADLTYNTDFAQVEADEQQVNLTRFSLFFPEKREFFLENQGTFAFGGAAGAFGGGAGDTPMLFYSRRIGLNQVEDGGRVAVVPIIGGGRLTGRLGRFSIGALDIQSDDEPVSGSQATNFSVVRVKRDVLRRSSIGAMYTGRSIGPSGGGRNDSYGVDGAFAFFDNLAFNTYWARTPAAGRELAAADVPETAGRRSDDTSYRLQADYAGDRYGVQLERLLVGNDFHPEVGFVRRRDMLRHFGQVRFSPRPRTIRQVRKFISTASFAHVENAAGRLESRSLDGEFAVQLQNSDQFIFHVTSAYEFLPQPFPIARGVTLPVGAYDFANLRAAYNFGKQRPVAGNVSIEQGTFYDGHKTTVGVSSGRVSFSTRVSAEPTLSVNKVDLLEGAFTTTLIGSRVTYTVTPRMFVSALLQYNSGNNAVAANVRLRWEYQPGSELFVVFNEQRDTFGSRFPTLTNRTVIVKINRLFRL
jgi:hypothetical protein